MGFFARPCLISSLGSREAAAPSPVSTRARSPPVRVAALGQEHGQAQGAGSSPASARSLATATCTLTLLCDEAAIKVGQTQH